MVCARGKINLGFCENPGRGEPRKIKRRPKGYSRLLPCRAKERAKLLRGR